MVLAAAACVKPEDEQTNAADASPQQDQDLLPVPLKQAQKRPYPPGCPVIYVDTARKHVKMDRVEAVFVDMSSPNSPSFVYRMLKGGFLVEESQLQYAPSCPVWAFHDNSWKPCVVWNSYQEWPLSEPRYSVQQVGSGALIHGISRDYIRYREEQHPNTISATPANKENAENAEISADKPVHHMGKNEQSRPNRVSYAPQAALESKRSFSDDDEDVETNDSDTSHHSRSNSIAVSPQAALERKRSFADQDDAAADKNDNNVVKRVKSADASDSARQSNHASFQDSSRHDSRETQRGYSLQETGSCQHDCRATQRGYPLQETRDEPSVATTFFFVPRMGIFTVRDIEAFRDQHVNWIMKATKCTIRYCSASSEHCSKFELTGTEAQIDNACNQMENRLVANADQHGASLALYYLALWNQHRRSNGEFCFQYCRRKSRGKSWMYAEILSAQDRTLFDRAIGRGGERKRRMERKTRCNIVFNNSSGIAYYFISGGTMNDVKECKRLVELALDDALVNARRINFDKPPREW